MRAIDKLNENKKLGLGVGVAIIIIAIGLFAFQLQGGSGNTPAAPTRAFYTDDNGKSFFKDDIEKFVPFTHNGKLAYRADVFECEGGHQFVGLVYRHTDAGRKELEGYIANMKAKDRDGGIRRNIEQRGMLVKKAAADDKAWKPNDELYTEGLQRQVKCPTDGKPATLVAP